MNAFKAWYERQPRGTATTLERQHGVSHSTVHRLVHGGLIRDYALAKRISRATGGEVTITELCETPQRRGRKA